MSKIGMRPISVTKAQISVGDSGLIKIVSDKVSLEHVLPNSLKAVYSAGSLRISLGSDGDIKDKKQKALWGLHRALLASKIKGAEEGFVSTVRIVGVGFKAAVQGPVLVMTLGYSHKIDVPLDALVSVEIDKTGQLLTLKSVDKFRLGNFCAQIRTLRSPEPYKGTGIYVNNETIIRKAGKSKS